MVLRIIGIYNPMENVGIVKNLIILYCYCIQKNWHGNREQEFINEKKKKNQKPEPIYVFVKEDFFQK